MYRIKKLKKRPSYKSVRTAVEPQRVRERERERERELEESNLTLDVISDPLTASL
jgi:hypothetical protein